MNELLKTIHENVRIVMTIQNMERNIALKYMSSVLVFFLALCVLGVTTAVGMVEYPIFYIIGLCYSIIGFCLASYLAIGAYQIKKKLNLLLEEVAQDKGRG